MQVQNTTRFLIKIDRSTYSKINKIAQHELHLDLLNGHGHYSLWDVDVVNGVAYVSILTHQPQTVSLLHSKFPKSHTTQNINIQDEKIQQIRTNFSIKLDNPQNISNLVAFLQNEGTITMKDLVKFGKLSVVQEASNCAPLIKHVDDINLTDTGRNITNIENMYKVFGAFRKFEHGQLTTRLPLQEHPRVHQYFRETVKKYNANGMSDINDSYKQAQDTEMVLRKALSHFITSFSGIAATPYSENVKKGWHEHVADCLNLQKKIDSGK